MRGYDWCAVRVWLECVRVAGGASPGVTHVSDGPCPAPVGSWSTVGSRWVTRSGVEQDCSGVLPA